MTLSADLFAEIAARLDGSGRDAERDSTIALAKLIDARRGEYDFYTEYARAHGVEDWNLIPDAPVKLCSFSLTEYLDAALAGAEYERDEDGMVFARVPSIAGAFTEGATHEEARRNLRDVIEGNVLLALQLGIEIPRIADCKMRTEIATFDAA